MKYQILTQEILKYHNLHKLILTKSVKLAIINYSDVTNDKLWVKTQKWGVILWIACKVNTLA